MMAEVALDQKIGSLLRMHEEAFRQMGGVPEEILYDRMKTVWLGSDERGEIVWHPVFLDFARYWGFTPRLCRPYRAQTKGKVESGVKYLRRNFLCGLQGGEPHSLADMNAQLREWISTVANQRVHGTTRDKWPYVGMFYRGRSQEKKPLPSLELLLLPARRTRRGSVLRSGRAIHGNADTSGPSTFLFLF